MIPIFEQGQGEGIGHSFRTFVNRFIEICQEHLTTGRAKAFAFILYDFDDQHVQRVLRHRGGFTKLDRLSGKNLSVFFLHSSDRRLLDTFNGLFLHAFKVKSKHELPFVLFFKVADREVIDIEIVELQQNNLLFAFQELFDTLENYIGKNANNTIEKTSPINRITKLAKTSQKIILEEFIRFILQKATGKIE